MCYPSPLHQKRWVWGWRGGGEEQLPENFPIVVRFITLVRAVCNSSFDYTGLYRRLCASVYVRACVRVCVCACVRTCACACVCVCTRVIGVWVGQVQPKRADLSILFPPSLTSSSRTNKQEEKLRLKLKGKKKSSRTV